MSKSATKKGSNKKHTSILSATTQIRARRAAPTSIAAAAAVAVKKLSLGSGNAGNVKMRKKKLSHQQASQARDMLDAEFRDLRASVCFFSNSLLTFQTPLPPPALSP
jgi:hypothetical protein